MDMNLPEGFLLARIRERFPKEPPTKLQLLALMGTNGIGWTGYRLGGAAPSPKPVAVRRERLLREGAGRRGRVFSALVDAYLSTGSGLSGVQPKILVPEGASIPTPNLLVKAGGSDYPGLAANEFLCLEVAERAGLPVAAHALSDDGQLLVLDRFDLRPDGALLGFEDVAALLDLRVGGALSDRKYRGSYEDVADLLAFVVTRPAEALRLFFRYVALTVLVRNGDGHLKNFGVLYDGASCWLAPLFDQVTTIVYTVERADGLRTTDRTMALRLRKGRDASGVRAPGTAPAAAGRPRYRPHERSSPSTPVQRKYKRITPATALPQPLSSLPFAVNGPDTSATPRPSAKRPSAARTAHCRTFRIGSTIPSRVLRPRSPPRRKATKPSTASTEDKAQIAVGTRGRISPPWAATAGRRGAAATPTGPGPARGRGRR
jgi:hypothetical protein